MQDVKTVFVFFSGMIAVCDATGQQIPELQGRDTPELRNRIAARALSDVEWNEAPIYRWAIDVSILDDHEKNELFEALLWMRNRYQTDLAPNVLKTIDAVLTKHLPPGFDIEQWSTVVLADQRPSQ